MTTEKKKPVTLTEKKLFRVCAPMFNFDKNIEEIVDLGIERKMFKRVDADTIEIIDPAYYHYAGGSE